MAMAQSKVGVKNDLCKKKTNLSILTSDENAQISTV